MGSVENGLEVVEKKLEHLTGEVFSFREAVDEVRGDVQNKKGEQEIKEAVDVSTAEVTADLEKLSENVEEALEVKEHVKEEL